MNSPRFSDQVAVITGASSGIGLGVAEELSRLGMKLVLTARRRDRLYELAGRLGNCTVVVGDIACEKMPQRILDTAISEFGRCDVVINGAGTMYAGSIEEVSIDTLCSMIRVNFEAVTRLAYVSLKHFQSTGTGHLINISSILGTKVRPNTGAYAGSKYAVEALSEALRMEVAKTDIKVSVIEPGVVSTELQNHFEVHPCKLLGISNPLLPSDVARCVRFILEQPSHVRIPVMMVLPSEQAM